MANTSEFSALLVVTIICYLCSHLNFTLAGRYLGAMAGTDGHVYCFPSGSERVLQVDTGKRIARSVGPNLRDEGMESMHQNKWQNGLTTHQEGCVYAIPLAGETVLRIRTGGPNGTTNPAGDVEVTT